MGPACRRAVLTNVRTLVQSARPSKSTSASIEPGMGLRLNMDFVVPCTVSEIYIDRRPTAV